MIVLIGFTIILTLSLVVWFLYSSGILLMLLEVSLISLVDQLCFLIVRCCSFLPYSQHLPLYLFSVGFKFLGELLWGMILVALFLFSVF